MNALITPPKTDDDFKYTAVYILKTYVIRWLIAIVAVLVIDYGVSASITSLTPSGIVKSSAFNDGGVISLSIVSVAFMGIGAMIAIGIKYRTLLAWIYIIFLSQVRHGYGTLSYNIIPTGFFAIMLFFVGTLALLQIGKDIVARSDKQKISTVLTLPALSILIVTAAICFALNAYWLFNIFNH